MRHAGDVENGIQIFERIEAGVIAEGTLGAKFVEIDVALEDDFARCRNFKVHRFTFDQVDRGSAKKSGNEIFFNFGRSGHDRRKGDCRIGADCDRDFHLARRTLTFGDDTSAGTAGHDVDCGRLAFNGGTHPLAGMFGGDFLTLPVHPGRSLVINLHAVHSKIALARLRISRGHAGKSDEASGIFGPALQDGEVEQGKAVAFDDFFAGARRNRPGEELAGLSEQRQHLQLIEEALRRLYIHEHANAGADLVVGVDADCQLHSRFRSELVDQELRAGMTFEILEKQCRTAGNALRVAAFRNAVGDLGDFKNGVGLGLNAFELAGAIERGDPLTEVVEGQSFLSA